MTQNFMSYINELKIGDPRKHKNLTIYPLLSSENIISEYRLLDEAIESEEVQVEEVDKEGVVEELNLITRGKENILIVEGEQIIGLKQNRIFNITILVGRNTEITVPVSCVEQGRWHRTKKQKARATSVASAKLRGTMGKEYTRNIKFCRIHRADQRKVWDKINEYESKRSRFSPTNSYHDFEGNLQNELNTFLKEFEWQQGQVGIVAFVNEEFVALDVFHHPEITGKLYHRMISSCAVDALYTDEEPKSRSKSEPTNVLNMISTLDWEAFPTFGLGKQLRVENEQLSASALVDEGSLIHLSAYPSE